jgi:hypothetical protein
VPKSRHVTEIHQPILCTPYKLELDCSVSYLPPLTFTFVPVHSLPSRLHLSTWSLYNPALYYERRNTVSAFITKNLDSAKIVWVFGRADVWRKLYQIGATKWPRWEGFSGLNRRVLLNYILSVVYCKYCKYGECYSIVINKLFMLILVYWRYMWEPPTLNKRSMVVSTSQYQNKQMNVSVWKYIPNAVYLLHVSATHVAIFREVYYKGYIHTSLTYTTLHAQVCL